MSMNELKEYAACLAESLAFLNERVAERQRPTRTISMGINPKKCKSCRNFDGCQRALNRKPMDNACREYKKKRR